MGPDRVLLSLIDSLGLRVIRGCEPSSDPEVPFPLSSRHPLLFAGRLHLGRVSSYLLFKW